MLFASLCVVHVTNIWVQSGKLNTISADGLWSVLLSLHRGANESLTYIWMSCCTLNASPTYTALFQACVSAVRLSHHSESSSWAGWSLSENDDVFSELSAFWTNQIVLTTESDPNQLACFHTKITVIFTYHLGCLQSFIQTWQMFSCVFSPTISLCPSQRG